MILRLLSEQYISYPYSKSMCESNVQERKTCKYESTSVLHCS